MYLNSIIILGVNVISVDEIVTTEDSGTLICELPCFSPSLQCVIYHFITSCTDVNVANITSDITGSVMTYSYPTQAITFNGLNSSTTYNYCVIATDTTNMMIVGEPVCGSFITWKINSENNDGKYTIHMHVQMSLFNITMFSYT